MKMLIPLKYIVYRVTSLFHPDPLFQCKHAITSGGPGYIGFDHCECYPEVRQGHKLCPARCKDFRIKDNRTLYREFKFMEIEFEESKSRLRELNKSKRS